MAPESRSAAGLAAVIVVALVLVVGGIALGPKIVEWIKRPGPTSVDFDMKQKDEVPQGLPEAIKATPPAATPLAPLAASRQELPVTDSQSRAAATPLRMEQDDGVIIDDTHTLGVFSYLKKQRGIYVTKNFKIANPLINPDTRQVRSPSEMKFHGFTYYVKPDLLIDQDALTQAIGTRQPAGQKNGQPLYTITFPADIIADDIKREAAKQIILLFPNAGVDLRRIAVIPPQRLKLFIWVDGQPVEAASADNTGNVSERITVRLTAPEATLSALANDARVEVQYTMTGYRVQQNVLVGELHYLVRANLHRNLFGPASFEIIRKHREDLSKAGISLGIIDLGGSSRGIEDTLGLRSAVTRNVLRFLAHEALQVIKFHGWMEIPGEQAQFDKRRDELVDKLRGLAQEIHKEIEVKNFGKANEEYYNPDLAPDLLGELKALVHAIRDDSYKEDAKFTYQGIEAKRDLHTIQKDDVDWKTEIGPTGTKIVVPKSVRVYDFSKTDFKKVVQEILVDSRPVWMTRDGVHEPAVSVRTLPRELQPGWLEGLSLVVARRGVEQTYPGGDEELDSDDDDDPLEFTFESEAVLKKEEKKLSVTVRLKVHEMESGGETTCEDRGTSYDLLLPPLPRPLIHLGDQEEDPGKLEWRVYFKSYGEFYDAVKFDAEKSGEERWRGKEHNSLRELSERGTVLYKRLELWGDSDNGRDCSRHTGYRGELHVPCMFEKVPPRPQFRIRNVDATPWEVRSR
jgi:hypothetical protein